jgi:riboflavin transporter FmnP
MNRRIDTGRVVGIAMFSALAVVVALVCQIIPPIAGFLSLDAKDAVISMAAFVYGPLSSVIISLIAAAVELFTFSSTGWYGFIMNFVSSAVFSLTASLIYKRWRRLNGALAGFISAIIATTGVMLLLNIFVTPLYMKSIGIPMTSADVVAMIPKILFPFNFAKSLMNSAIAMMLYKPLSVALKRMKLIEGEVNVKFNKNSVIILTVGAISLAAAVVILIVI